MKFNNYWNIPKNAKQFFNKKNEQKMKEKYGVWYTIHLIFSIVIAFVPVFCLFSFLPESASDASTAVGNAIEGVGGIIYLIGSFAIGVGLVNIFMALIKQYLGHFVTLIGIIGGALLVTFSTFLFSIVH